MRVGHTPQPLRKSRPTIRTAPNPCISGFCGNNCTHADRSMPWDAACPSCNMRYTSPDGFCSSPGDPLCVDTDAY